MVAVLVTVPNHERWRLFYFDLCGSIVFSASMGVIVEFGVGFPAFKNKWVTYANKTVL